MYEGYELWIPYVLTTEAVNVGKIPVVKLQYTTGVT